MLEVGGRRSDPVELVERIDRRSSVAAFTPEALKANMPLLTLTLLHI